RTKYLYTAAGHTRGPSRRRAGEWRAGKAGAGARAKFLDAAPWPLEYVEMRTPGPGYAPVERSVQSDKNRSVQPMNTTVLEANHAPPEMNTTELNTTNDWDRGQTFEAAETDKRIEIRFNKRKNKEPYYYW